MNFVERYTEFAQPLTEASRRFHYYIGYLMLSQAVERKAWYMGAGSFPLSPCLWIIFIGPSSMTKKSTALRIGMRYILGPVFEGIHLKYPSEGSHESFVELLADQPKGIIIHSEFASFMNWLNRDYNSALLPMLTDLYDLPENYVRRVGTRSKMEIFTITEPFINIATCTTMDWMSENLNESKVIGGFLPRFCMILDPGENAPIPETPDPDEKLKSELIFELQDIRARDLGRMKYSEGARAVHNDWYMEVTQKLKRSVDEKVVPFISRRQSDVHKFAMLNAIMNQRDEMNTDDLDRAIGEIEQIMEFSTDIVTNKLTLSIFEKKRNKVLDVIKHLNKSGGEANHWKVLRAARLPLREFKDIIEGLAMEQTISVKKEKLLSGKEAVVYSLQEEEL